MLWWLSGNVEMYLSRSETPDVSVDDYIPSPSADKALTKLTMDKSRALEQLRAELAKRSPTGMP